MKEGRGRVVREGEGERKEGMEGREGEGGEEAR